MNSLKAPAMVVRTGAVRFAQSSTACWSDCTPCERTALARFEGRLPASTCCALVWLYTPAPIRLAHVGLRRAALHLLDLIHPIDHARDRTVTTCVFRIKHPQQAICSFWHCLLAMPLPQAKRLLRGAEHNGEILLRDF